MKNKISWLWYALAIAIPLLCSFAFQFETLFGVAMVIGIIGFLVVSYLIFKDPFLGVIMIVFCLPFERIPTVDLGFINIKINLIIGAIFMVYFLISVILGKTKIKPYPLIWPLILFWSALGLSLIDAVYLPRGIMVFVLIFFTSLFSILINQYLDTKDKLVKIIWVLFYLSLLIFIFSIYQFMGDIIGLPYAITGLREGYSSKVFGFPRVQAFSQEPLYLGNSILIPLGVFIAMFLGKTKDNPIPRKYLILIIFALFVILGLTLSRGAYLAFGVMMLVIFIFMARKFFTLKVIITAVLIGFLGIGAILWFVGKGEDRAIDEFIGHATVGDLKQGESVEGRLWEFERAINIGLNNSENGVGIGNYGAAKKINTDPDSFTDWDIVNNQYIELFAETGYPGIIAFAILIIFIVWRSIIAFYSTKDLLVKYILVGFFAAFIGTLIQYNFFSTLYIIHIWVLIGLLMATQNIAFFYKNEKN